MSFRRKYKLVNAFGCTQGEKPFPCCPGCGKECWYPAREPQDHKRTHTGKEEGGQTRGSAGRNAADLHRGRVAAVERGLSAPLC